MRMEPLDEPAQGEYFYDADYCPPMNILDWLIAVGQNPDQWEVREDPSWFNPDMTELICQLRYLLLTRAAEGGELENTELKHLLAVLAYTAESDLYRQGLR